MFGVDVLILLFEIFRFPSHYGMMKFILATLGPQIGENWAFHPSFFGAGARTKTQKNITNFRTYGVLWQSFAKIGLETSKNLWTEK